MQRVKAITVAQGTAAARGARCWRRNTATANSTQGQGVDALQWPDNGKPDGKGTHWRSMSDMILQPIANCKCS